MSEDLVVCPCHLGAHSVFNNVSRFERRPGRAGTGLPFCRDSIRVAECSYGCVVYAYCCVQSAKLDAHPLFERVSEEELANDPAANLLTEVRDVPRTAQCIQYCLAMSDHDAMCVI